MQIIGATRQRGVRPAARGAGLSLETVVVATQGQISCDLAGQRVLLNLETGVYYGLNEVGSFLWNLAQEPVSLGSLRDMVMDEYDVDSERCERDLLNLMSELIGKGLVEITDAPAS